MVATAERGALVSVTKVGTSTFVTAKTSAPFSSPLPEIVVELVVVVGQEFVLVGGIGDLSSCAAPLEPTAVRDDVDVLDVGDPDWVQSLDAAAATGARPGQREACSPARQSEPPSPSCFTAPWRSEG